MKRSIEDRLSRLALCAVGVLLACTVPAGWCDEGAHASGPHYYRRVEPGEPKLIECDVAVYGGTPAGVTAAIQAARMGKKAVLLSFNRHVGGMTSGGLTATDIGNKASVGGLALEFYNRIGKISNFRPSQAETLFLKMLDEAGVPVLFQRCLQSVQMRDGRLVSATMEAGETIRAAMFVDATYEGDLLAAANVSHRVGREPAGAYGETLAGGWQNVSWSNVYQFCRLPLSPYVKPGDPESGLLPEISSEPPGKPGDGDFKVQAYNFRVFLSEKEGKIPFPKPPGYDSGRYALLARFLNFDPRIRWTLNYTTTPMTDGPVQMRVGDSNNAGSFSSDYVGGSHRWPDGTYEPTSFAELPAPRRGVPVPFHELYELRERIFQDHVNYQQGLMYFLATDPRVPETLQDRVNRFGLDPREFQETGYWPHQLYVREGRRMVSNYVMTQADCEWRRKVDDSIGLASYAMDSHFCQRVVVEEDGKTTVRNEGGFGHGCRGPYPVSYRSIVPKREECANLLVPVCLSASHVAYGSIRMEPVFMILGQSAATAAAMAIDKQIAVQDVSYETLRQRLLEDGQLLVYDSPVHSGVAPEDLEGVVVDDAEAEFTGSWQASAASKNFVGAGYHHDGNTGNGKATARFSTKPPKTGRYQLRFGYTPNSNRASNVTVEVQHAGGSQTFTVNQKLPPPKDGLFLPLGVFDFQTGTPAVVTVSNRNTDGYVVVDAVQWVPVTQ
jgi:hypothetical protein